MSVPPVEADSPANLDGLHSNNMEGGLLLVKHKEWCITCPLTPFLHHT